jgi:molybdenum cofactor cytidylyltransferase
MNIVPGEITGVLLAAGHGRRWAAAGGDSNKLLHRLPCGTPLVVAAGRSLKAALPNSVAVVRRRDVPAARALLDCGFELVFVDDGEAGVADNLARAVVATADAAGWVVALGDMPYVQSRSIGALADALRAGHMLVAPQCRERRGRPFGFDASYGPELAALSGDHGLAGLLQRHADRLHRIEVDDPGVLLDIDVPLRSVSLRAPLSSIAPISPERT